MSKQGRSPTPVEQLVARLTWTASGATLTPEEAAKKDAFPHATPAAEPQGWFWIGATPRSAETIRRDGHKAVGTVFTTWIPPQEPGGKILPGVQEPDGNLRTYTAPDGSHKVVTFPAGGTG